MAQQPRPLFVAHAARRSWLCYGNAAEAEEDLWTAASSASGGAALLDTRELLVHRPPALLQSVARARGCVLREVSRGDLGRLLAAACVRQAGRQRYFYRSVPRLSVAATADGTDADWSVGGSEPDAATTDLDTELDSSGSEAAPALPGAVSEEQRGFAGEALEAAAACARASRSPERLGAPWRIFCVDYLRRGTAAALKASKATQEQLLHALGGGRDRLELVCPSLTPAERFASPDPDRKRLLARKLMREFDFWAHSSPRRPFDGLIVDASLPSGHDEAQVLLAALPLLRTGAPAVFFLCDAQRQGAGRVGRRADAMRRHARCSRAAELCRSRFAQRRRVPVHVWAFWS
jgi:hypothetical protein